MGRMTNEEIKVRNKLLIGDYIVDQATLTELAKRYNISKQRVSQILDEAGIAGPRGGGLATSDMAGVSYARRVYDFIVRFKINHNGDSPTTKELAKTKGVGSAYRLNRALKILESQGKITVNKDVRPTRISVVDGSWIPPKGWGKKDYVEEVADNADTGWEDDPRYRLLASA
jgi:hypothetical protein